MTAAQPRTTRDNRWGGEPIHQIRAWLEAHAGWQAKEVILDGCQAEPDSWDDVIAELLEEGSIETQNEDTTAQYRASQAGRP